MSLPELDQELRTLVQEPLDLAAVRTAINHGVSRRQRRRRSIALAATVAAVLVVAAGIGVVHGTGVTSGQVAADPDWLQQARPVVIPAGSTLTPYRVRDVVSPVTATVETPSAGDAVMWRQDVDTLYVAWQYPTAVGIATASDGGRSKLSPTAMTQRAYVITKTRDLPRWQLPSGGVTTDQGTPTTPAPIGASVSTVIGGHPAVIADDAQSAFAATSGENRWVSWQLNDGRWVHVWVRTGGDTALIAFAKGIVEKPTTFIRHLSVGVTAPGYTVEGAGEVGTSTTSTSGEVELCPVGTKTMFATALTPSCLTVLLVPTSSLGRDLKGTIRTVTVDGSTTHINKTTHESFADIGHGYSVLVGDDPNRPLSDLDSATLAASVRIDPDVKLSS